MIKDGSYILKYFQESTEHELKVEVSLVLNNEEYTSGKNIYKCVAKVNGVAHIDPKLNFCVNPQSAADRIGKCYKDKLLNIKIISETNHINLKNKK